MKYLIITKDNRNNRIYAKVVGGIHVSIIDDDILIANSELKINFTHTRNKKIISLSEFFKGTKALSERIKMWG